MEAPFASLGAPASTAFAHKRRPSASASCQNLQQGIPISMRPWPGGMAIHARLKMQAERPISIELTELSRREQMLRQAGEELLQEADVLREKYDKIMAEVNQSQNEERSPVDQ
jgi:hypothetical protein